MNTTFEKQQTLSSYLEVLKDGASPIYVKSLALTSMMRSGLIEPDLAFYSGYAAESVHGQGILKDVFYEYGRNHDPMDLPLGYFDLFSVNVDTVGNLVIEGWVLDSEDPPRIMIWLNGKFLNENDDFVPRNRLNRDDIPLVFPKYPEELTSKSGFEITILDGKYKLGNQRPKFRLLNSEQKFMDIYDGCINISETGITRCRFERSGS